MILLPTTHVMMKKSLKKKHCKIVYNFRKIFPKTTILRTNLVFGTRSYFIRFLTQCWMEDFSNFEGARLKHYRFNPIYYNDLNDMVQILTTDESETFNGKKLIANGNESLSFVDIDNLIKQTYSSKKNHTENNKTIAKLMKNWQIFFHGNTHITNYEFMLNYLQVKAPQFKSFENASQLLNIKPKSFREYYTTKAEKFDDRIKHDKLIEEQPDDFRFPYIQNYWKISLD